MKEFEPWASEDTEENPYRSNIYWKDQPKKVRTSCIMVFLLALAIVVGYLVATFGF